MLFNPNTVGPVPIPVELVSGSSPGNAPVFVTGEFITGEFVMGVFVTGEVMLHFRKVKGKKLLKAMLVGHLEFL